MHEGPRFDIPVYARKWRGKKTCCYSPKSKTGRAAFFSPHKDTNTRLLISLELAITMLLRCVGWCWETPDIHSFKNYVFIQTLENKQYNCVLFSAWMSIDIYHSQYIMDFFYLYQNSLNYSIHVTLNSMTLVTTNRFSDEDICKCFTESFFFKKEKARSCIWRPLAVGDCEVRQHYIQCNG